MRVVFSGWGIGGWIMPLEYEALAEKVLRKARALECKIATAESCTGGLIAATFTAIAGSSDVFERGFVTYANQAKHEMIGVPKEMLLEFGAVSEEVALAMAKGALKHAPVGLAIAVTGVAGPSGGTAEKPVGTVHIACAMKDKVTLHLKKNFSGGREDVRNKTVEAALHLMLTQLEA